MTYTVCEGCNYQKATKELHPESREEFISCPRCGRWRQYLDKKASAPNTREMFAYIKETDTHYEVGGGGKGNYRIQKGDELLHLGSLDINNFEAFEEKANEMLEYNKVDTILYTQKQLGVWFELDYINQTKREFKDDD